MQCEHMCCVRVDVHRRVTSTAHTGKGITKTIVVRAHGGIQAMWKRDFRPSNFSLEHHVKSGAVGPSWRLTYMLYQQF
jgi:hypothetical protein